MTPLKRYLIILLFIGIGIGFGIGFGAIFYRMRKKKDDEITMKGSIMEVIIPSIFFWVTIGILIIIKFEFSIPLELFIISGIILTSFLSAITTKKGILFLLGFGVVVTELLITHFIRWIIVWINCRADKIKAENDEKAAEAA